MEDFDKAKLLKELQAHGVDVKLMSQYLSDKDMQFFLMEAESLTAHGKHIFDRDAAHAEMVDLNMYWCPFCKQKLACRVIA